MVLRYSPFLADALRLTKRLKPLRVLNLLLIKGGFWLSRITGKVIVLGRPFSVSAEAAGICNLKCPECIVGRRQTKRQEKMIDFDIFTSILERHKSHGFYMNLYFQGEPFLNKNLEGLIAEASRAGFYTSVSTNGHYLDENRCREIVHSGLDRLIVSLDGLDQETYSFYRRGGNWERVVRGIEAMAKVRQDEKARNPLIVVQFLVNRKNESQIKPLKQFARQVGADIIELKSMQVYDHWGADVFLPASGRFNRYLSWQNGKPKLARKGKGPCQRLWSHAVYTSDGIQVSCCYDKVPEHAMGKILGEDPWFSPEMNAFRKRVIERRDDTGICCNCSE